MEIIEVNSILKLLVGARFIGRGFTSLCFLLSNGEVLKLYIDTYNTHVLFKCFNMEEHLNYLGSLSNEYFIGPKKIYKKDGKIIGYSMPYIKGKHLKSISRKTRINDTLEALQTLIEETEKISMCEFKIGDLHNKNIIYNGKFYIIDLDNGQNIKDYKHGERLKQYNVGDILTIYINTLFGSNRVEPLQFTYDKLKTSFEHAIYRDYHCFEEFVEYLKEELDDDDPTIQQIRNNSNRLIKK